MLDFGVEGYIGQNLSAVGYVNKENQGKEVESPLLTSRGQSLPVIANHPLSVSVSVPVPTLPLQPMPVRRSRWIFWLENRRFVAHRFFKFSLRQTWNTISRIPSSFSQM